MSCGRQLFKEYFVSIILKLCALQSWAHRRHSDTSVNLFTISLLSKWLWLSVIKALNILKLFNHRSQDLRSRCGFDSFHGKDDSKISHTHSLMGSMQIFFCLHEQIFTICNIPNWTRPHNLQQLGFPLSDDGQVFLLMHWQNFTSVPGLFWWQHIPHSCRLSINKIPTTVPLPLQFNCNLPDSGTYVTRPNQGLSSLTPGVCKMRDPGNEIEMLNAWETKKYFNVHCSRRTNWSN